MPSYTFLDKKTGKEFDDFMSISEMEEFLKKNKHITQVIKSINIVSGIQGVSYKNDQGWKDNLSRIAEAHPQSPLAQRYGKKTIKQSKTEQVLAKHRKRQRGKN
jgi:hypothetical protein